jgi:hypothetical protein
MSDTEKPPKDGINYGIIQTGGSFVAGNVGVGHNVTIVSRESASGLDQELEKLKAEIAALPSTHTEHKENIEIFRSALESEVKKGEVNKHFWNVTSQGLIDAAKTVAGIAPSILATANLVANWFSSQ